MKSTKVIHKARVTITLNSAIRARAEAISERRGQSLSEHIEKLIEEDLRNPQPSPYDPLTPADTKEAGLTPEFITNASEHLKKITSGGHGIPAPRKGRSKG